MKTDVRSTFTPQAAHPPAEAIPKLPQAAHPVIPIIPSSSGRPRPSLADALIKAAPTQDFNLARDLTLFARVRAEGGRRVVAIFVASTAVTIANMFGQVRLNEWNGQFFDAVGRKDLSGFVHDLWTFLVIIAVLLALTVANTFLQERLKFRLREWITRHLLVEWLKPLRVYQLSFAGEYGHNPDQRIQEDTRLLGDYSADLGCGIVYSLLQIVAFVGVLWALSAQVTFQVAGYDIAIPGYMVWCALGLCLDRLGSDLARGTAADCPERRAICARGGIPLRPRSGQRIRREHRAAWRGEETNNDISRPRSRLSSIPCGGYLPPSPTSPGSHRAPAGCRSSFRYSWPRRPISAAA